MDGVANSVAEKLQSVVVDSLLRISNSCLLSLDRGAVYGYSYGVKGSRKLERECYHNLSFLWLMEGLKPDHRPSLSFGGA